MLLCWNFTRPPGSILPSSAHPGRVWHTLWRAADLSLIVGDPEARVWPSSSEIKGEKARERSRHRNQDEPVFQDFVLSPPSIVEDRVYFKFREHF